MERCIHVKNRATTVYFSIARLGRVSTYVRYNRSRDGRGGKHSRNRRYPTTGPPQTLRRQTQRLSRFGRRVLRSGRPDADEEDEVVGGVVGGRLKVHLSRPPPLFRRRRAARWRLRNRATPARWLGWLRIRWCPGRLQAECGHLVGSIPHLEEEEVC